MRNKKILIVDFDKESLNSLSKYLQDEGFRVSTSTDGLAGLETFLADNPHLVIVEAMLPKLDGFDLCTKITTAFPNKIPVIIISGVYRDSLSKTEALRSCGASAFFAKPIKKDEILSTILNLLKLPETKQEAEKAKPREKERLSRPESALEMLSQQSLETFHASPRPDDGRKTKIEEAIEEELQEAITTLGIKPRDKKSRKEEVSPEIDNMLKNTLAEFGGLTTEKKKSQAAPAARVAPKKPEVMAPILVMPAKAPEKKPVSPPKAEVPEVKPAVVTPATAPAVKVPAPDSPPARPQRQEAPVLEERKSGSGTSPFDKYNQKKKAPSSPRFMIFGITALLVMGSVFVFLKLKKHPSPVPQEQAAMIQQTAAGLSAGAYLTGGAEGVRSKKEPGQKPLVIRKETPRGPDASPDKIEPLLPSATPNLQFQDQVPNESAAAPKKTEAGQGTPASEPPPNDQGQANSTQKNQPVQEQPANDTPALPAKVKLGDLVPLEQAETPPQTISTFDPVYPALAFQMNVQGTVLVNVLISENGGVIQTAVLKSPKNYGFEKAAQDAVRKWKFKPATKGGVAVRVWKTISITFKK